MLDKKTIEDLFEILEPNVDVETGSSGDGLYGNYCEWKNLDNYDDDTLKVLYEYFLNKFPNKKKYANRTDIISFLRIHGIPEETVYDNEDNFPDSQSYFNDDMNDYLYKQYEINYFKYVEEVESIKKSIMNQSDPLTIKALLFAVFSLTESYMKQVIRDNLPCIESNVTNDLYKNILTTYIHESLKYSDKTEKLSKDLGLNFRKLPHIDLRNVLSHSIGVPSVADLIIIYPQDGERKASLDIMKVIDDLMKYAMGLRM